MSAPFRNAEDSRGRGRWQLAGRLAVLALLAWASWALLRITLQYLPIADDVAFLRIKQDYIDILPWKFAFFVHVFTSLFALLAGFTQFAPGLLRRRPRLHRWLGRAYVVNILLITGPASLLMGFYANGGLTSRIGFITLAALWLFTTWKAFAAVKARDFASHREWMIRSYALTLSAVTLRAWKWLIVLAFAPPPMTVYRIVAWLGFAANLVVAEWWIRRTRRPRPNREPLPTDQLESSLQA